MDFMVHLKEGIKPSHEILSHLFKNRLTVKKPCIIFLGGQSGEGKSWGALELMSVTFPEEVEDEETFTSKQIIYTPSEYKAKLEWILFSKEAKDKHVLIFMEARELIKSKLWFSIINQVIGDINAMSRTVKPLCFVILSQSIGDIDKDTRKTITFYGVCARPFKQNTRMSLYKVYLGTFINRPLIMQRKIKGKVIYKDGKEEWWSLKKFVLSKPKESLTRTFEILDKKVKSGIIRKKLEKLDKTMMKDKPMMGKLERLVEIITKDDDMRNIYTKRVKGGKIKIKKDHIDVLQETYNLSGFDLKELERMVNEKYTEEVVKIGKEGV